MQFRFLCLTLQRDNYKLQTEMDIVNRLITFMEAHGIGSTQFADNCGIPRPSLSQLLSGRNKKISDAVIAKIHNAYPTLSILWLLFGEGQMESTANIAFSAAQNAGQNGLKTPIDNVLEPSDKPLGGDAVEEDGGLFGPTTMHEPLIFDEDEADAPDGEEAGAKVSPTVTIPADGSKSIVNIVVFYSDNSFQSFVPSC